MCGNKLSPVFLLLSIWVVLASPAAGQSRGPLLEILPQPLDFDTVFCGSSRCIDVTMRNAGDTALTVQSFDPLVPPFSGGFQTPVVLQPGEQRTAQWCYTPTRVLARDSIGARYISDNRIPYSFGFLVDGSDAMRAAFPGAANMIGAAHDALGIFVAGMMADGSPPHEGATFAYSTSSQFRLLRGFTDQRDLVLGAIPGTASGAHACIWHGMDRSIALMQGARHRKVLIVVNGSEDAGLANCGPYSAPGVASAAVAAGMIIHTISLNGAASASLAEIALQTGGLHHDVSSMAQIEQAVHDIMLGLQRSVDQQLIVRGEVVSPSLAFEPPAVLFPTTAAGDTARRTVWLRNIGTSPMEIGDVHGGTGVLSISMTKETVMPGDSLAAEVSFHPDAQAYSSTVITADINGCDPAIRTLTLRGMSYLPVNPSPGPVLAAGARVIDGGRIPCDIGGEISIPLRNVGDKPLQAFSPVVQCSAVLPPDSSEWEVEAGAQRSLRLRVMAGQSPGADSCGFSLATLSRRSSSTMLVIDASSALRAPWRGIDGAGACQLAVGILSAGMSRTTELQDRMGVITASMSGVQVLQPMTQDRLSLTSIVPAAGSSDTTALLAAIETAFDTLEHYDGIRRLFILTAGSTDVSMLTGSPAVGALARRAAAIEARITALSFGSYALSDSLIAFLDLSGSERRAPADPEAFIDLLGDIETRSVDTVESSWMLRWTNISSDIITSPEELIFEESHVAERGCEDVMVTNPGEVPLVISDVSSVTDGFSCGSSLPLTVPVGGSAALRLCYVPPALGSWSLDAVIRSNSCIHPSVTVHMRGEATDSNTVRLSGDYVTRPGGLVTIPVYMEHVLPDLYDVRHMTLRISYDPSLLYPDMDQPLLHPTGIASGFAVTVKQEYDRNSGQAVSTYDVSSSAGSAPIVSAGTENTLFSLRLRAFLGRVLKTDVALIAAAFPESEVALGRRGSATVRIDSMPWLEQRLVDASALWGVLGKNAPNPSRGRSVIPYTLREPLTVRLALYDLHGRLVRILYEGSAAEGTHHAVIDTHGLAAGAYVCRLESRAGVRSRVLLVSNQEEK